MSDELDLEAIENELADVTKIKSLGYMDLEHFYEHRHCIGMGLQQFGDLFTTKLGLALMSANLDDSIKITRYWYSLCESNALLYKMFLAKQRADGI